ncbi:hypothetical protein GC177_05605 [bacterium]|nr:hypothetical protein [bacterium]
MTIFQRTRAALLAFMLAVAFTFSAAPVQAAAQQGAGVAVLNLKKIMDESTATKSIRSQIEKKSDEYKKSIAKDEERLRARDKELAEKRSTMSAEAFEKERRNFQAELQKVQLDVQKKRVQLDRAYGEALGKVNDVVSGIVKDMAKENGFAITFPASQIIFYADFLDITNEVLKRLNQKLGDVKVEIKPISDAELTGGKPAAAPAAAPAKK